MYTVNKSDNKAWLKEDAAMKEPQLNDFFSGDDPLFDAIDYSDARNKYEQHNASLRTIQIAPEYVDYWEDGEKVPEDGFVLIDKIAVPLYAKAPPPKKYKLVAIPAKPKQSKPTHLTDEEIGSMAYKFWLDHVQEKSKTYFYVEGYKAALQQQITLNEDEAAWDEWKFLAAIKKDYDDINGTSYSATKLEGYRDCIWDICLTLGKKEWYRENIINHITKKRK